MPTTFTVTVSDSDMAALDSLLRDPTQWVTDVVVHKVIQARKRLCQEWLPLLYADPAVTSLPASDDELVDYILARPDYLDRLAKDSLQAAEVAARAAK